MNAKPFDLGITVGRFQTLHTGHVYMIERFTLNPHCPNCNARTTNFITQN